MGTNYYWRAPATNHCDHCGREDAGEVLHIGKSSVGWCFALHVIPERGIRGLADWDLVWAHGEIRDEYGAPISKDDMRSVITNRRRLPEWKDGWWKGMYSSEQQFHMMNHSERGPNGLLRHCHRSTPGDGTWDLCEGEFS